MSTHDLWHTVVLFATLFGAAALAVLVLAPLVFDELPEGLRRGRPVVLGLVGVAGLLLVVEWRGVH